MPTEIADKLFLNITRHVDIEAPAPVVFDSILEELGPGSQMPDGKSLNMKIEPWPGGRWFRDLGNNTGHFWGHVQVIKPPTLLEICGPMFMSYAAVNHVQYRITEQGTNSVRLSIVHRAMGEMPDDHRKGVVTGWDQGLAAIAAHAVRTFAASKR